MRKGDIGIGASIPNHGSYFCSKLGRANSARPAKWVISRQIAHTDKSSRTSGPDKIPADAGSFPISEVNGLPSCHAISLVSIAIGVLHAIFPRSVKNDSELSNPPSHSWKFGWYLKRPLSCSVGPATDGPSSPLGIVEVGAFDGPGVGA